PEEQLDYSRFIADEAHARGLAVGLKNSIDHAAELEPWFDFAVNEQCFQYDECRRLEPFLDAGKNVIIVEYRSELGQFCGDADQLGAVAMRKKLSLRVWRQSCP
nr:endo alpha-1,4 polygalactosaminidase [Sporichthyaceae bacterium]